MRKVMNVIFALSLATLITSCGSHSQPSSTRSVYSEPDSRSTSRPQRSPSSSESSEPNIGVPKPDYALTSVVNGVVEGVELNYEQRGILEAKASLTDESNARMQNFISGVSVEYRYSELFNIDVAMSRYYSMPPYHISSAEFINGSQLNVDKLRQQVLANNKAFKESWSSPRFTEFSEADFDRIFGFVVETLQFRLDSGDIDTDLLDSKLIGLHLLHTLDAVHGSYSIEQNMIALNLKTLALGQERNPDVDYLRTTTIHETEHFIQAISLEGLRHQGLEADMGIAYKWEDIAINPINTTWFFEAAAEQLMMETYGGGIAPTNYATSVNGMDFITLSTILGDGVEPLTAAKITLQHDLGELFKLFGCETHEDQYEILKMMFSYEYIIPGNNDFSGLLEIWQMDGNELYLYKCALRASMGQTLAKRFYANLSHRINSQQAETQVAMEEVFALVSIFETSLAKLTGYTSKERVGSNMAFLENYVRIQNEFFQLLAGDSGLEFDQLSKAYAAYHLSWAPYPVHLTSLESSKSEYFLRMAGELQGNRTITIRAAYEAL